MEATETEPSNQLFMSCPEPETFGHRTAPSAQRTAITLR